MSRFPGLFYQNLTLTSSQLSSLGLGIPGVLFLFLIFQNKKNKTKQKQKQKQKQKNRGWSFSFFNFDLKQHITGASKYGITIGIERKILHFQQHEQIIS